MFTKKVRAVSMRLIFLFISISNGNARAIELEDAVTMLESSGDLEAAEIVTYKLTQVKKIHYWRIEFMRKYPQSSYIDTVYFQAWEDVNGSNNTAKLTSLLKAYPIGAYSLAALDQLLDIYKKENTILGFQEFIKNFPNSPQAVEALDSIYQIAYVRADRLAKDEENVSYYDEYLRAFPASPLRKQAFLKSSLMENDLVIDEVDGFFVGHEDKERVARRLYNEMRTARDIGLLDVSQRKFELLQNNTFIATKVYTELMDRKETLEFRKEVLSFQKKTGGQLANLALIYQQESAKVIAAVKEMTAKNRRLVDATNQLSFEQGRLADAIYNQISTMEAATNKASNEMRRIFDESNEKRERLAVHNRDCAADLAENGRYSWFSGC